MIRFIFILFIFLLYQSSSFSQTINIERNNLTNFLKRQYEKEKCQGIKIVEDYNKTYLISILTLDKKKYPSTSAMHRVAKVKSAQQIGTFINGTSILSETIIKTYENKKDSVTTEIIEIIREKSASFIKGMELLTCFVDQENSIFIYCIEINQVNKNKK